MANKWRIFFEYQSRYSNDQKKQEKVVVRPGLLYAFNSHWAVGAGYLSNPTYVPKYVDENRIWQQLVYTDVFGKTTMILRIRNEQRFLSNTDITGYRVRLMARGQHFLDEKEDWMLVSWDEYFHNLNDISASVQAGFDQNRFFVGPSFRFHPQARLEAGYLNVYINREKRENKMLSGAIVAIYASF